MFRNSLIAAAAVAAFSMTGQTVKAQPIDQAVVLEHATAPGSRQFDFTSKVTGRAYRVQVSLPPAAPPPGGFPVIYVMDGDGLFGTFSEAARLRGALGGELAAAVVVGVGYPEADQLTTVMKRRTLDLTPTPMAYPALGGDATPSGDAEGFYKVLTTEVAPRVNALTKVDGKKSILFGHSLGGLFSLYVLLNHTDAYSTYLVSSPSIWWAQKDVLKAEPAFARRIEAGQATPRVFITIGGEEQTPPKARPAGMSDEQWATAAKSVSDAAMVDNARALAGRLSALKGMPGYEVKFRIFEGESHLSVLWAETNPLLDFALPPR